MQCHVLHNVIVHAKEAVEVHFVGCCLATFVFVGNLLSAGGVWVVIYKGNVNEMRSQDNNWDGFDHASHACQ